MNKYQHTNDFEGVRISEKERLSVLGREYGMGKGRRVGAKTADKARAIAGLTEHLSRHPNDEQSGEHLLRLLGNS